jgi:hypothetical protein
MEPKLSEKLKECLVLAMNDPTLDISETIEYGIHLFVQAAGEPIEVEDEEEFFKLFEECQKFVIDEVIAHLILKGQIEVAGMRDGELTYQLAGDSEQGDK